MRCSSEVKHLLGQVLIKVTILHGVIDAKVKHAQLTILIVVLKLVSMHCSVLRPEVLQKNVL